MSEEASLNNMKGELDSSFSNHFKSPTLTVYLGPDKLAYYLNRDVLAKTSPFIASIIDDILDDSIHLNTDVDIEDAFDIFIEYAYKGTYTPRIKLQCGSLEPLMHLHAMVYVLAERLVVPALKGMALDKMVETLKSAGLEIVSANCVVQTVYAVYAHTNCIEGIKIRGSPPPPYCGHLTPSRRGSPGLKKYRGLSDETPTKTREGSPIITPLARANFGSARSPKNFKATCIKKSVRHTVKSDPMRDLLAHYCAENIDSLKNTEIFKELLHEVGDFAEDLIMCISEHHETSEIVSTRPKIEFSSTRSKIEFSLDTQLRGLLLLFVIAMLIVLGMIFNIQRKVGKVISNDLDDVDDVELCFDPL